MPWEVELKDFGLQPASGQSYMKGTRPRDRPGLHYEDAVDLDNVMNCGVVCTRVLNC